MLPSAAACSHLVVSIHLHWLIITKQVSPFYTPFLFLPLQLWPGRSFHNSACVATQTVRFSPKFCRNSVQLVFGFPQAWGNEKEKGKREGMCNTQRHTDERERELCGSTPAEKETWFIITKKSTADVSSQILPLPPIIHSRKGLLSLRVLLLVWTHTYTYTHLYWATVYIPVYAFMLQYAQLLAHTLKSDKIVTYSCRWNWGQTWVNSP